MKEQIKKILDDSVYKSRETIMQEIAALCEAECQARVERIFKEIATECFEGTLMKGRDFNFAKWQAIKKQEGVIIKQGGDAQSN